MVVGVRRAGLLVAKRVMHIGEELCCLAVEATNKLVDLKRKIQSGDADGLDARPGGRRLALAVSHTDQTLLACEHAPARAWPGRPARRHLRRARRCVAVSTMLRAYFAKANGLC